MKSFNNKLPGSSAQVEPQIADISDYFSSQTDKSIDRDRICNDQLNVSVASALIGGFAYSNLQASGAVDNEFLNLSIYVMSVIAVHACTCSCLASVLLYAKANGMHLNDLQKWFASNKLLLSVPMAKFIFGATFYLVSVILMSYRDLQSSSVARMFAVVIGCMSVMMVFTVTCYIQQTSPKNNFFVDVAE